MYTKNLSPQGHDIAPELYEAILNCKKYTNSVLN